LLLNHLFTDVLSSELAKRGHPIGARAPPCY
jgi:hypothetical protein